MAQSRHIQELGVLFTERRRLLDVRIDEMAEQTGIPTKHLRRIEKGQWRSLPSAVYTQGFVRTYARALGMDADRAVEKYKKEARVGGKDGTLLSTGSHRGLVDRVWAFTQGVVSHISRRVAALAVFCAILAYVGYQLSVVFAAPPLTITEPVEEEAVVNESSITLAGVTEPGITLLLNNQHIEIGTDGTFRREVELLPGINTLEVVAESRFGERTLKSRTVIYKEPERPLFTETGQDEEVPGAPINTSTSSNGGEEETSTTTDNY